MIRRFVYDADLDCVVELGEVRHGRDPREAYRTEKADYEGQVNTYASPRAGARLLDATLERAARREYAHKRFGTESRWAE